MTPMPTHLFCIAPMLDLTDRHCRFFLRLFSRHLRLYTEMVTTAALLHGDKQRLLNYHAAEHPLALQLAGSDPRALAQCAKIAEDWGYDEVNLNVGCPSPRVQSGRFGACLMAEPDLVAECVAAMSAAVTIPVTVKTRIGIDERDSYAELLEFIRTVARGGCRTFIVHARKAWLQGLSPKENREIPPLRYAVVQQLKRDVPDLHFILNGGLRNLQQIAEQLPLVDGVMLGRAAYENPYLLAEIDQRFFAADYPVLSRQRIVEMLVPYIAAETEQGTPLHCITRHILNLFHGVPGARAWRRTLSEGAHQCAAGVELVELALRHTPDSLQVGRDIAA